MALLLHIDTATSYGTVAISDKEMIIAVQENFHQKEHASFLHPAIEAVLKMSNKELKQIEAICVSIGPGSYTGLRVGLAAAKGLCFALKKPLIAVNTLQAMALAASKGDAVKECHKTVLYAPMIDARRDEVFTALFTAENEWYSAAQAMIVNESLYNDLRENACIVFSGDGSEKLKNISGFEQEIFSNTTHTIQEIAILGFKNFEKNIFEDIAYCEPMYVKPFYFGSKVK